MHVYVCIYINVCWYLFKYACMLVYVYTCIRIYVGVHVCVCVYILECIRVREYVCVSSCVWLRVAALRIRLVRSEPSYRRPGPIRIRAHCGPDTMVIWRPIHGMIRRSVLVRAVKTRRRFGSKTASFHVSVCSCVFTVVSRHLHVALIISCGFLLYFTSLITCTTSWDIHDCSL